ncbi:MAG TPA: DUF3592 domain-containing protein [Anaerolineales bacterium]|nr:DUF3592 domain-containing protein [Anaerolineales bacterium]
MNTEKIIVVLSICGSLFIFDAIFLGIIFYTRRKVAQAASWPSTLGNVTLSMIQMRSSSEGGSTAYPVVHYAYQVMGQPYEGNKVMPGMEVGGSGARKVVDRYPAGSQVMVYYNPEKPSEALLERGMPGFIKWFWIILVILDIFLCGLGAFLTFTL